MDTFDGTNPDRINTELEDNFGYLVSDREDKMYFFLETGTISFASAPEYTSDWYDDFAYSASFGNCNSDSGCYSGCATYYYC